MTKILLHKSFQNALNARTGVDNSNNFSGEIPNPSAQLRKGETPLSFSTLPTSLSCSPPLVPSAHAVNLRRIIFHYPATGLHLWPGLWIYTTVNVKTNVQSVHRISTLTLERISSSAVYDLSKARILNHKSKHEITRKPRPDLALPFRPSNTFFSVSVKLRLA